MTTPTPISMRDRLRTDYAWTVRQKQVLELIARGRSNTEIAEALGLSLAGAKWHVSEILSKLQADQREEAADYWRRYNGLAPRFERIFRSIAGGVATKWVAGTAAVLVAGAATAVIVAIVVNQDRSESAAGEPNALPTTTALPSPSQAAATATISGGTGQPAPQQFSRGQGVNILDGRVLYWTWAGIEGPHQNLWRAYRDADGDLVSVDLYENLPDRAHIAGSTHDFASGRLAVLLCVTEYCGGYGWAGPDSEAHIYISEDGGVSWRDGGRVPRDWYPVGFLPEGLLAIQYTSVEQPPQFRYELYPSGELFETPARMYASWTADGELYFSQADPDYACCFDRAGNPVVSPYTPPEVDPVQLASGSEPRPLFGRGDSEWSTWSNGNGITYFGHHPGGQLAKVLQAPQGGLYVHLQIASGLALGRHDRVDQSAREPVLINLERGTLHPIEDIGPERGYFHAFRLAEGVFTTARPGAGDCLNIRGQPRLSSMAVTCAADGVLVELTGELQEADGVEWAAVRTPDGREGWASAEFLDR